LERKVAAQEIEEIQGYLFIKTSCFVFRYRANQHQEETMTKSMTLGLAILASLVSLSAVAVASTGSVTGSAVSSHTTTAPKTSAASADSAKTHGGVQLAWCRKNCL
jgi:hypothetical protein